MSNLKWEESSALRAGLRNARKHSANQINAIAESIKAFGFNVPILCTGDGEIICGEARWQAALQLGIELIPVLEIEHLSPPQIEAYRIADNRLAEMAKWDKDLLAEIMRDISFDIADLQVTGFSEAEINRLLNSIGAYDSISQGENKTPAAPSVAMTVPGDIWECGNHRLMCGDSTSEAVMSALMQNEFANMVFTDPPYGMRYKGSAEKTKQMILNDDAAGEDLIALVSGALINAKRVIKKGAGFYVCLTWRTYPEFAAAMKRAGLPIANCIVWDKGNIGASASHYRPQHEFIFYGSNLAPPRFDSAHEMLFYSKGEAFHGGRSESDVWQLSRDFGGDYEHPTQKPVALVERAIINSSKPGDIVLDCFGGSGTTLLACEKQGRAARLIELDPKYCDVIVRRWETFTGKQAQRVALSGLPSSEIQKGRMVHGFSAFIRRLYATGKRIRIRKNAGD